MDNDKYNTIALRCALLYVQPDKFNTRPKKLSFFANFEEQPFVSV